MVCQVVLLSLLTRRTLVKLAATLCLAALSLAGCATDVETTQGGFLAGLRPAKPSPTITDDDLSPNPDLGGNGVKTQGMYDIGDGIRTGGFAEVISDGYYPLPNEVCGGCEVTLVTVPTEGADNGSVGEIDVMSDGGDRICKIFLNQDGSFDTSDCER